jgi:hypothetical protein
MEQHRQHEGGLPDDEATRAAERERHINERLATAWRTGRRIDDWTAKHIARLRRLTRRWITLTESRGSEGGRLWAARLTWTGNREGTAAWRESAGHREGVYGAAAQGPRDMAKAGLFEAQFPGMEMCILRLTTPGAEPPASGESPLLRPNPSGWWTVGSELT